MDRYLDRYSDFHVHALLNADSFAHEDLDLYMDKDGYTQRKPYI